MECITLTCFLNKTIGEKDNLLNQAYFLRPTGSSDFSDTRNGEHQRKRAHGRFKIAKSKRFFINAGKKIQVCKMRVSKTTTGRI